MRGGGEGRVVDFSLDQLCATSDISVEEKGVRNFLLMEYTSRIIACVIESKQVFSRQG